MRVAIPLIAAFAACSAFAKLPPLDDAARAKADQAKEKSAWADKVSAYETCRAIEKTAATYRKNQAAAGKEVRPEVATPPCVEPGAAPSSRPLEASEAHSPPDAAQKPPSSPAPQASR